MASATNEASTTNETSAATAAGDPERGAVKVSHNSDSSADPPKTRALLSWSSGKDSAWALHVLRRDPTVEVVGLLTTLNGAHDRIAMHGVRRSLLRAQARAVGLPLWERDLPDPCSNEDY
ncbi:MAG: hypothetical protein KC636_21335, partial [Myxococcales bacterium]|nr:hypothetical protein [Myxococcales bacterium]